MTKVFSRVLMVLLTSLLVVGSAALLPSCGEGDGEQVALARMDISGATHLLIAPGSGNKLFKITEDGYVLEVTYEDEYGNPVTIEEEAEAVYDAGPEYVIVGFCVSCRCEGPDIIDGYLVRKADGITFSLENAGFPHRNGMYRSDETVFTDSSGNIYYATDSDPYGTMELIKLNTENKEAITKILYSPSGDGVGDFIVDKDGNAVYEGGPKTGGSEGFIRLRTAMGSIHDGLFEEHTGFWLGLDGAIYCITFPYEVEWLDYWLIEKVSVNTTTGVPTKSEYAALNVSEDFAPLGGYKLELQDRVIFVQTQCCPPYVFEAYNPTNSPRILNVTDYFGLTSVSSALATDNFYYLHGSNNSSDSLFIKVDPTDDSYTALSFDTDEYYLYTWAPSVEDEIIVNALRMADGVMVVGKFDVSGNLTILDEESDVEIIVLERIQ